MGGQNQRQAMCQNYSSLKSPARCCLTAGPCPRWIVHCPFLVYTGNNIARPQSTNPPSHKMEPSKATLE